MFLSSRLNGWMWGWIISDHSLRKEHTLSSYSLELPFNILPGIPLHSEGPKLWSFGHSECNRVNRDINVTGYCIYLAVGVVFPSLK